MSAPEEHTGPDTSASRGPTTRRNLLRWTAGGGAALAGVALARAAQPVGSVSAQSAAPIVGSWIVTVLDNPDDPNEHELASFTSDGLVISTSPPTSPPSANGGPPVRLYATPGFGAWTQVAGNQYRATFVEAEFDENGNFSDLVTLTVNFGVAPDGASGSGSFSVVVTDAGGNVLFDSMGPAGHFNATKIVA